MFNTKEKFKKQVLAEIDEYLEEKRKELDETYSKIEGYSKSKDKFHIEYETQNLKRIEAKICAASDLKIIVKFM